MASRLPASPGLASGLEANIGSGGVQSRRDDLGRSVGIFNAERPSSLLHSPGLSLFPPLFCLVMSGVDECGSKTQIPEAKQPPPASPSAKKRAFRRKEGLGRRAE